MDLYVFRHGQTDWNLKRIIQGNTDISLNPRGREQAKELQNTLSALNLDVIFSSDLERAKETAEIATNNLSIPHFVSPLLREINMGDWEGESGLKPEFRATLDKCFNTSYEDFHFPNGETKMDHVNRLKEFIKNLKDENSFQKVAIAFHGGCLYRLFELVGLKGQKFKDSHCKVFHFQNNSELNLIGELCTLSNYYPQSV